MERGTYYRLEAAASTAWELLAQGSSLDSLCAALACCFIVEPALLEEQVAGFLTGLQSFELIVPQAVSDAVPPPSVVEPVVFPGLVIHRFTDLQELFWLDPVHEVDETGWPASRPNGLQS